MATRTRNVPYQRRAWGEAVGSARLLSWYHLRTCLHDWRPRPPTVPRWIARAAAGRSSRLWLAEHPQICKGHELCNVSKLPRLLFAGYGSPAAAIASVSYSRSMHPRGWPLLGPDLCHKNCSRTILPCSWNSLITCPWALPSAYVGLLSSALLSHLVLRDLEVQVGDLPCERAPNSTSVPASRIARWAACQRRTFSLRFGSSSKVDASSATRWCFDQRAFGFELSEYTWLVLYIVSIPTGECAAAAAKEGRRRLAAAQ